LTTGCAFRVGTVGASNLDSLGATIITGLNEELNGLSFTKGTESLGLDGTLMNKEILATSCKRKRKGNIVSFCVVDVPLSTDDKMVLNRGEKWCILTGIRGDESVTLGHVEPVE
jgi:hypothetical protein